MTDEGFGIGRHRRPFPNDFAILIRDDLLFSCFQSCDRVRGDAYASNCYQEREQICELIAIVSRQSKARHRRYINWLRCSYTALCTPLKAPMVTALLS